MPIADVDRTWGRAIIHVDMDAFYASVEVLDNPDLRGRPVIVGGRPGGRGVVAAASYEARARGVRSAMSAARAARLCPEGVFLPSRMERYAEISRRIFRIFRDFSPLVEPLSIDEAFLDVSGCRRLFGSAEEIGRRIRDRVAAEIGLVASVGVAPNKFLAKLASDLEKPAGFVVIGADEAAPLLAGLPVEKLWGVGDVSSEKLRSMGVRTVADLLAAPEELLVASFGDHVRHLLELAVGHDDRPVVPSHEARSIGNEMTFAEDIDEAWHLEEVLNQLVESVARRLRLQGLQGRTVVLKARFPDFTTVTRSVTLAEATDSTVVFREAVRDLFRSRLGRGNRPLRLVGVTVQNLQGRGPRQGELFVDPERERDRTIDRVLDDVHGRFGPLLRRGLDRRRD